MKSKSLLISILLLYFSTAISINGQSTENINWISFNQLNDSLKVHPKKVFVNFYADWCVYCKEMDRTTFRDDEVIKKLNESYYAVKMNIETDEKIVFGAETFVNKRTKRVNPIHEIALLLASRKNKPFSLPAYIVFNENFEAEARYFQYLDVPAFLKIIE
ncbi:thioredoxin family protein [Kaistella sp.]|uniref:thioredoxin family protein n=1 Tax=Kaistella sp. TaxID=2782235 RepID=UPI0035A1C888